VIVQMAAEGMEDYTLCISIHPRTGQPAPASVLVGVSKLIAAYSSEQPDAMVREQRVAFGTSGHRGSSFKRSFNEWHILAIDQDGGHTLLPSSLTRSSPMSLRRVIVDRGLVPQAYLA
jgi:hypothetical protein